MTTAASNKDDVTMSQWQVKPSGGRAHKKSRSRDDLFDELIHAKSLEVEVFARKGLQERLNDWGIHTETIEHPQVR